MRFLPLAVALVTASAGVASADSDVGKAPSTAAVHRRVILIAMPDAVFSATAAALGPWSIAVEAIAEPAPINDEAAALVAQDHDATAVAWIDGDELVIYDDLRRASERQPAPPVTDDVTAAALALSIKTAVRRPVVVVVPPPPPPDPDPPPPPPDPDPPVVIAPAPPPGRRLRVAAHLGMGLPVASAAQPLVHLSARLSIDLRRAGLAVIAELGGEWLSSIDSAALAAGYRDLIAGAGAEWRRALRPGLALTPSARLALHRSRLEGTAGDRPVSHTAVTPSLQLGLAVDQQVGPVRVGGLMTAELRSGRTRYQVEGSDVLVVPRSSLGWALRVSF